MRPAGPLGVCNKTLNLLWHESELGDIQTMKQSGNIARTARWAASHTSKFIYPLLGGIFISYNFVPAPK